jgi:putative transcriptional regulator
MATIACLGAVTLMWSAPLPTLHAQPVGPGARTIQFHPGSVRDLARGKVLVATRDVVDPNFRETVVLLTDYDSKGASGLIINRRTEAPMSQVLPNLKNGPVTAHPVFFGGPVEAGGLALVRSEAPPEGARHVFADVFLLNSRPGLDAEVAAGAGPDTFRVYIGYSGWGPGQLERETIDGLWHVLDGDPGLVFDADPASLWQREMPRGGERMAHAPLACCRPPTT